MAKSHPRPASPDSENNDHSRSLLKRLKIGAHADQTVVDDPTPYFAPDLFHPNTIQRLNGVYRDAEPFKHALIEKLFQDDLLEKVKDECLTEIAFTQKETDIYRVRAVSDRFLCTRAFISFYLANAVDGRPYLQVYQTGDLASLNYLTPEQVALLPSLLQVRDALYSPLFRQFIRTVTGCGPLSGSKQDMSVRAQRRSLTIIAQ
jgi:Rps23 Pro-64 3,4-dihydroxylase Tpa1-like proline 4-hydroxylase